MPPTKAMSRVGSSRCRITTNFWWCEPPLRTRMSSSASAPRCCSSLAEGAVLAGEEADLVPVRAPDQPAHVDPALVGAGQHLDDLAVGVVGHEQLVGVALPVGEQHQVAVAGRLEAFVQLAEVGRAVDQRPDEVALGPGAVVVEAGGVVVAFGLGEEPLGDVSHVGRR